MSNPLSKSDQLFEKERQKLVDEANRFRAALRSISNDPETPPAIAVIARAALSPQQG